MRRLVWLGVLFALAWSGWWFFAAQSFRSGVELWFAERRAEGWQADVSDLQSSGYPFELKMSLMAPVLADPQTGVAAEASQLDISALAWWPGYVTVRFPEDEILVATPVDRRTITAQAAQADLRLHPGTELELQEMALTGGPWELLAPTGSILAAQGLVLRMKQEVETPAAYAFEINAPAFQPGSVPRAALRVPADWPIAFDSLALDATIIFDRPFDRTTIEDARPQPRHIDLRLAEAVWGNLQFRSAAALEVTTEGVLSGEVSLQARNWEDMLSLAESARVLPSGLRPQLENILRALARGSGNPDAIDVTIAIRQGTMFMGFIPLGPAPRLVLR